MDDDVPAAIVAARTFSSALRNEGHSGWAERIASIAQALEESDIGDAVNKYEQSNFGGIGSLSDILAKDERTFNRAWSDYSDALRRLRPKVKMSDGL
jgi:hypothetical protein